MSTLMNEDLGGTIAVHLPCSDITSSISVNPYNSAEADFVVRIPVDVDLTSSIQPIVHNDIPCTVSARVRRNRDLMSFIRVRRLSVSDIPVTISVGYISSISSSITARQSSTSDLNTSIIPRMINDIQCTIHARTVSDIASLISVNPYNFMKAVFDVTQPPHIKVHIPANKDAFVRLGIPRLNYGTEIDMFVGKMNGDTYRALLGFDISSVPKNMVITSATLDLYNASPSHANDVDIYTAGNTWDELGVTWRNQPVLGSKIASAHIGGDYGYQSIDIRTTFAQWYAGATNNGLLIKASNEDADDYARVYTKEQDTYVPMLTVEYYDPIVYSNGRRDIGASIQVRASGSSDINGSINVHGYWTYANVSSSIIVVDRDTILGDIVVSKPYLPSIVEVAVLDDDDIAGSIVVRSKDMSDLDSGIAINRPTLPSEIVVPYHSDIPSSINVPHSSDLVSTIVVAYPDLYCAIAVRREAYADLSTHIDAAHEYMLGSITARRSSYKQITGTIVVASPDLPSSVRVPNRSNLFCSISVRQPNTADLVSAIAVNRTEVPSYVLVLKRSITASININKPDMPSKISVQHFDDVPGTIIARAAGWSDFVGTIGVSTPDLLSSISVARSDISEVVGSITARQSDKSDIPVAIAIRRDDNKDLVSSIRLIVHSDLPSILVVRASSLSAKIVVRRSDHYDLQSDMTVDVKFIYDMPSTIHVGSSGAYAFIM